MINYIFSSFLIILTLFTVSSCIVPESTHVEPTFHLLSAIDFDQNDSRSAEPDHFLQDEDLPGYTFYLKQIEVPSYMQENRIISRLEMGKIEFRENDRWGESIVDGVGRVTGLNLSRYLNSPFYSVYPHRKKIGTSYEVNLTIYRFEKVAKDEVLLQAGWEIFSRKHKNGSYPVLHGKENLRTSIEPDSVNEEIIGLSKLLAIMAQKVSDAIYNIKPIQN